MPSHDMPCPSMASRRSELSAACVFCYIPAVRRFLIAFAAVCVVHALAPIAVRALTEEEKKELFRKSREAAETEPEPTPKPEGTPKPKPKPKPATHHTPAPSHKPSGKPT